MSYVELHCHSNFSLLDGACFPEHIVEAAYDKNMKAIALTDHNGLYGVPQFVKSAGSAGIKPIIGAELTLENDCHVTLLVKDKSGYSNLARLITKAQLSGQKGSPRLDFAFLTEMAGGLICLSGCQRGEIASHLLQGKKKEAEAIARSYMNVFPSGSFFIELQHHLNPYDKSLCRHLIALADKVGLPMVATNNVHYIHRESFRLHDVLVCIKNGVSLDASSPFRKANSEYYLKNHDDMCGLSDIPKEAIDHTQLIADMCNYQLDFSSYCFPTCDLPEGETPEGYLRKVCYQRIPLRYGHCSEEFKNRLGQELELIRLKNLCGYFIIVWDIMEFARANGILAQGRGSAASSLVAYLLGITPVDPIRHGLFMGRFLNESSTVPDIDIDIDSKQREKVIQYVYTKYGKEFTAMVCTYIAFRGRSAIREVGKVFDLPPHTLDRMAKSISAYSPASAIEDLKDILEFKKYLNSAAWENFCTFSAQIADFPRHLSIHVGGMIISSMRVSEMVPLERARAEGRIVCQWDKDGVDDAGLIKVDLLGLRMLSLIDETLCLIKAGQGIEPNFDTLQEDDPQVYDMIGRADTIGVFQVESRAQMQSLPRVRPVSLEDLGIQVAIIRPGPLQGHMVHPYMRRRNKEEDVIHLHPLLEPILSQTMGVVLFQEQILQVAMAIADFTAGQANGLRKAMGRKKSREEMEKWRHAFLSGAKAKNIKTEQATKIFNLICGFAEFGFCKSHAMSFALLCYRSAYLKLYYPSEFYCALLNNQPMGFYAPEVIIGDAKRHGIEILPVDVNKSNWECTVERQIGTKQHPSLPLDGQTTCASVRLGFRYVKELGEAEGSRISSHRNVSLFSTLDDFILRTRLNKGGLRNLIAIGAFDGIERSRRSLLWALKSVDGHSSPPMSLHYPEKAPVDGMTSREELLASYLIQGFSSSGHLLSIYRDALVRRGATSSLHISQVPSGSMVITAGYNVCIQAPPTAKGFAFVTLEDEEGLMNIVIKPDIFKAHRVIVRTEPLLLVEGVIEKKDGIINVIAHSISPLRGLSK